ncbi:hypothetical protein MLD38_033631 [Melastoma candidum]|uniref:Uncharacterized protein n=1 Tax=Melastoma candidum TaxID=119954 RepID=A0ACB9MBR3_9MYRT|nr:hypothetical protein MLD38_033631 [Melastoma candidum]
MALNMKSLTQALAKTAAVIEKTVQTTVQEVTGPKPLQDYELLNQIGSAGPALSWKLYSARPIRPSQHQYPLVCVWLLDKRSLSEARARAGLSKAAEDAFLDIIRADAAHVVRIRHPGVVHVVQALDETKHAMAMVTEPLFASAANTLGNFENLSSVPKELKSTEMGLLEVKHGLLQIAETLDFLHFNARLIHRSISPENVLITSSGAWKLGGFGFTVFVDQAFGKSTNVEAFHYSEYDAEDSVLPLQPSLNYTAPELVRSGTSSAGSSSDIFSFGCLAYHLITHKPLFDCHNNVKMYNNTLMYLSRESFSDMPSEIVPDLQRMLSANESFRPTALDFTGSPFFRQDTRLRALRFLDHMLERDNMQKSEFLKAFSDMWKDFDSRVLRYKVLPPLCAELRNLVMQPMILPMVLTIAESQDKNDFEVSTLPALVPVFSSAAGETLLLLIKHADLMLNKTNAEQLKYHLLPLLVRAYDDTDAHIQEEALKKSACVAKQLDDSSVKQAILPRIHGLALKTTVAAVRVNALLCLAELIPSLDKHGALDILQTTQRCTAVDRSAPTLMCTLGVANSILKQYGIEFAAEHVLPLLTPLLTAQQLNVQQFAKYMLFVKDILRKIEEKRGVSVTESSAEIRTSSLTNGVHSQSIRSASGPVAPAQKSTPSWDEDWGSTNKAPVPVNNSSNVAVPGNSTTQSIQLLPPQMQTSELAMVFAKQMVSEVSSAADIEWPPKASLGGKSSENTDAKRWNMGADDSDPFANWPPRPGGSGGASGSSRSGSISVPMNGYVITSSSNSQNFSSSSNGSWAISSSSLASSRNNQENLALNSSSLPCGSVSSTSYSGYPKQNQGNVTASTFVDNKSDDLGSIFGSSKREQSAPRLAPPPSTAVGRGRGRGGNLLSASRSKPGTKQSEQPPLLDLL